MMRIIKPNETLKFFGFNQLDIENLTKVVCSNLLNEYYEVEEIEGQVFDFGSFVNLVISNKKLRTKVVDALNKELVDFPNCIINNLSFDASTMSFKLNLFLLLVDSLEKTNDINPMYLQYLELDKRAYRKINLLIDAFFEMCRLRLFNKLEVYNLFATSNLLERSGWVGTNVPENHKESIAEHMYTMYVMAMMYLPATYEEEGYDKDKILKMILIHDLAETLTGDIPHPNKTLQDELIEDLKAKALWCNLLYNECSDASWIYECWLDWSDSLTFNARVAHDFDAIQLNYQFFTYACKHDGLYSDYEITRWTRRQPQTALGKEIYNEVILKNPKFAKRIGVIKQDE